MDKSNNVIFHVDVNSAFLSWEAAYRVDVLGESVDLREVPSVVGGDEEKRHGIVLAKSTPAKKFNIQTGEPLASARKKCPDLIIIKPNFDIYVKASKAFIELLKGFAPNVEQYSIDEVWCDMTGTENIYGNPVVAANSLKDRIYSELGFTVNIGISSNKLLAKMAGDFEKPNRVHTLFPSEIKEKMWPLPVRELFFVGSSTEKKLSNLGIKTIGQLANTDLMILKSHFKKHGEVIYNYANGYDFTSLVTEHQPNKGYGNSITVAVDITDYETAKQVFLSLCETVASRLRVDGVKTLCLAVSITDCEFCYSTHQKQFLNATNVTNELYQKACEIFLELWDKKTPIRQLGVQSSKVSQECFRQYNLFDMNNYDKLSKLDQAVDNIRNKYGEDSINRASFLKSEVSHMTGGISKEKRTGGMSKED